MDGGQPTLDTTLHQDCRMHEPLKTVMEDCWRVACGQRPSAKQLQSYISYLSEKGTSFSSRSWFEL